MLGNGVSVCKAGTGGEPLKDASCLCLSQCLFPGFQGANGSASPSPSVFTMPLFTTGPGTTELAEHQVRPG